MTIRVVFIGLGNMGYPMAGHLSNQGYQVTVVNRSPIKAQNWQTQFRGNIACTACEAAKGADFVIACVGNDDDVREITLGATGCFQSMAPGSIFIDHTTASAHLSRELYNASQQANIACLDAPVSGGQVGAENGNLTVMAGGELKAFDKAKPIILNYAATVQLMGPAGSGQLTKMVNHICITGLIQSLAEGIHFAKRLGLDAKAVLDVISQGAAQSWQMENRGHSMIENKFDFGFAVDWLRKDLAIALEEAEANGVKLPLTEIVNQYYAKIQKMGGGRWDSSSLIALLERNVLN